jgi:hypothetical protein
LNVPQDSFEIIEKVSPVTHFEDKKSAKRKINSFGDIESPEVPEMPKKRRAPKCKKEISKCPHPANSYYAKGMCLNCYHAKGRTKMADVCGHPDRVMYANGVCKNCYLSEYHKAKRLEKKNEKMRLKAEKALLTGKKQRERKPKTKANAPIISDLKSD